MESNNVFMFTSEGEPPNDPHPNGQNTLLSEVENTEYQEDLFFDGNQLIVDADSFSQVTGYSRKGIILFKDVLELVFSPDWQSFLLRRLKDAYCKRESVNVDFWFSHQSGEIRLAKLFGRGSVPHDSEQGLKLYLIEKPHPCKDVVLEESPFSRYYRLLNFPDYLFVVSLPDTTILFVNNSYAQFYNTTAENLLGKKWIDFLPAERSQKYLEMFRSFTPSSPSAKIETYVFDEKGNKRWREWTLHASYNKSGTLKEYSAVGYEVTHFRILNDELAISRARYEAIIDSQSELIVRHTTDSTILFVNNAFARFSGSPREHFIGLKWFDLVPVEVAGQVRQLMEKLTPENPSAKYEMINKLNDGKEVWFSWISSGIFDEGGKLVELQVVGRDITERKDYEFKLRSALEEVELLKQKLEAENIYLKDKFVTVKSSTGILYDSGLMEEVMEKINQVAVTDSPVLIYGETGTGKEMVAQAIHLASTRRRKLMITVNCAALPPSLIESELFGREKGAYTGALSRQVGRFELAHNSTIFLDEIGELPTEIQVKLLRVLQFGEFQMLGSPETRKVDVRILAATNKDLTQAMADGSFRSDLYYRLNVFPINLPPLRKRKEDIPLLAWAFTDEIATRQGKRIDKISTESMNRLLRHDWPGNIRELRNVIEYSIIMARGPVLDVILQNGHAGQTADESLENEERRHIERVLNLTGWRIRGKEGAAERLGLKESTLRFRMKKLGIQRPS